MFGTEALGRSFTDYCARITAVFVGLHPKYGGFYNYLRNSLAKRGHSHSFALLCCVVQKAGVSSVSW